MKESEVKEPPSFPRMLVVLWEAGATKVSCCALH